MEVQTTKLASVVRARPLDKDGVVGLPLLLRNLATQHGHVVPYSNCSTCCHEEGN
jgi:hypothetical protein